jgi:hypothetical protein
VGKWQSETFFKRKAANDLPRNHQPRFTQRLKDDAWIGERVFIIGGGPSVAGFDLERLDKEKVIGVNMAYNIFECDLHYFGSILLMMTLSKDQGFKDLANKCCLEAMVWNSRRSYGCDIIEAADKHQVEYGWSLESGIPVYSNSGLVAINLADLLGAKEIYLLGFDLIDAGGKTWNYHNWYPDYIKPEVSPYQTYIEEFRQVSKYIRADVYNCSLTSALDCFPTARYHELF